MFKIQIIFLLTGLFLPQYHCEIRLTRSQCTTVDKEFSEFGLCHLKMAKGSTPSSFSFELHLLKLPVTNCLVHIELHVLRSLYSPVLINGTWDACAFMETRTKYRSLMRLYNIIANNTNMNHSCPYDHDVYMYDFVPPQTKFPWLGKSGEFLAKTSYIVDGKVRLSVDVGFSIQS